MENSRVVNTFLEMVAIDSPSWHEQDMCAWCARWLEEHGFEVSLDEASREATGSESAQIIATRAGEVPGRVAFSAHMDCVEPCRGIKPQVVDGRITSDGTTILSSDDKAGIAQIFEGVARAIESGEPLPAVTVLLSVCEEVGLMGAKAFPDKLFDEETLTLVLDCGGSPGEIVLKAPHHYDFKATFHGRAAHAGAKPEAGINAIALASLAVASFSWGRLDAETTANVGVIEGGTAENVVPDTCVVRGECRSTNRARFAQVKVGIEEALRRPLQDGSLGDPEDIVAPEDRGSVDIEWDYSYRGYAYAQDDPDVQLVARAVEASGLPVVYASSGGGSDANVLNPKGCKAIPLGCGMTDYHSLNESVAVADLENGAKLVENIIYEVTKSA